MSPIQPAIAGGQDCFVARLDVAQFAIGFPAGTLVLSRGQKGVLEVRINREQGFAGNVTVTAPYTKPIKIKLTPASGATTGSSVSFNYKIKKKAVVGTYQLVFTGRTDAGAERTAAINFVVQ
jgi:hypothetical protein